MSLKSLAALLASGLAIVNVALAGGTLALGRLTGNLATYPSLWADLLPALSFSLVGAFVLWRRPGQIIGWLLGLIGLLFVIEPFGFFYATYTLLTRPGVLPGGLALLALHLWGWGLAYGTLIWLVLLFPTGRPLSPRWTWVGVITTVATGIWLGVGGLSAWRFREALLGPTLPPGAEVFQQWSISILSLVTLAFLGAVISIFVRLHRSAGIERQQLKWFVYAAALAIGVMVVLFIWELYGGASSLRFIGDLLYALTFSAAPIAIGLAVLRYRLWNIDPIINRTLVYTTLTATIIGIYALIVGGVGALIHIQSNFFLSVIATGVAAVLFEPLRTRLQRAVNRLMYGERDNPYTVISRLGRQLETALAPEAVLPTIVTTLKETLKLSYAAIALDQGERCTMVAAAGTLVPDTLTLPLNHHGETIGRLILGPRAPGESFTPAERRLLADLARQAGAAAHAVRLTTDLQRLTADLQQSRERLVTAREEERRRLRRDLHDGLGPQLASHSLRLEAARDFIRTNPDRAEALLNQLIEKSQGIVVDIRRLVYALRPPALDELGLVGAVREYTAQSELDGLQITFTAPERLPPLPAAVEVAAYRIIQEALTNVIRHARAKICQVSLALQEAPARLEVEIKDNGIGLPSERHAGIGLTSMRERAEELGGACLVEAGVEGGTQVKASLPLGHD